MGDIDHSSGGGVMRYCLGCSYALMGLETPRCPECGRGFDLSDPKSTRTHPPRRWSWYARRAGIALGMLIVLSALAWGWLYWGWRQEHLALAQFSGYSWEQQPFLPAWLDTKDGRNAAWLQKHIGPAGFMLNRVIGIHLGNKETDIAPIGRLTELRSVSLDGTRVTDLKVLAGLNHLEDLHISHDALLRDLSPLTGVKKLQTLEFVDLPGVTDYRPIGRLSGLTSLTVQDSPLQDLAPLAGLTRLRVLAIDGTRVSDIAPIASLPALEDLLIAGTSVRDFKPLWGNKTLRYLEIDPAATDPQMIDLRYFLPRCTTMRKDSLP